MVNGLLQEMVILPAKKTNKKIKINDSVPQILHTEYSKENSRENNTEKEINIQSDKKIENETKNERENEVENEVEKEVENFVPMNGWKVVFTGKLVEMSRAQAEEMCLTLGRNNLLIYLSFIYLFICLLIHLFT